MRLCIWEEDVAAMEYCVWCMRKESDEEMQKKKKKEMEKKKKKEKEKEAMEKKENCRIRDCVSVMHYIVCIWCIGGCAGMEYVVCSYSIGENGRGGMQYVVCFLRKWEPGSRLWRIWENHSASIIVGTGVLLIRLFSRSLNHFFQVNRTEHLKINLMTHKAPFDCVSGV